MAVGQFVCRPGASGGQNARIGINGCPVKMCDERHRELQTPSKRPPFNDRGLDEEEPWATERVMNAGSPGARRALGNGRRKPRIF